MKPSETLTLVAERMADPRNWTPKPSYEPDKGCVLDHLADELYGEVEGFRSHIELVTKSREYPLLCKAICEIDGFYTTAGYWNDRHTHAEVLSMVHRAARLAKEAGE